MTRTDREIELLYAWRAGKRSAGDRLMRAHYGRVLAFFRVRVSDVAEDLTQRTFLVCTEARDRVRAPSFRRYLFGVARNLLYRHFEALRRAEELERIDATPHPELGPLGIVSLREEQSLLVAALGRINTQMQVAIALYYVEGLRVREIAEVLKIPVSTVTTRIHRGREALREELARLRAAPPTPEPAVPDLESWSRSLGVQVSSSK